MEKRRMLELAKRGVLAEIEKWDNRSRRALRKSIEAGQGIGNHPKTEAEYMEYHKKYEAKKEALEKEFEIIDRLLF